MTPQPLPQSPAYQEVVRGLLRMHKYTVDGEDENEAADVLRESMGEPWERLTPVERQRIAGLSKDLYTVSDRPPAQPPEPMNPLAPVTSARRGRAPVPLPPFDASLAMPEIEHVSLLV